MRAAGVGKDFKENPNLRDNWTDAEGYYRKWCLSNSYNLDCQCQENALNAKLMSWQQMITTEYTGTIS